MSRRRVTDYDDALRSAFGRVRDVTPDQAREAAERMEEAGRDERAAQLREYAADMEALDEEEDAVSDTADSSKPAAKAARKPAKGKPRKRPRSATGKALRQAATEPDRIVAGAIRSTASIGWSIAAGIVALVLVYLLVTKGPRSIAAIREVEGGLRQAIYPKAAFPEFHTTTKGTTP